MAAVLNVYGPCIQSMARGLIDWDTNAIKCGLLTAYTPSEDHDTWTVVKAAGTEHANANGYATGGATLGTKTQAYAAGITLLGSASIVWTATGALTGKYVCVYDSVTDYVLFYVNLDGAGGDVTATDAAFTINNASGYFSIDVSP